MGTRTAPLQPVQMTGASEIVGKIIPTLDDDGKVVFTAREDVTVRQPREGALSH